MKKPIKKLLLSKETLRDLGTLKLNKVAGGVTLTDCNPCSFENTCARYCVDEPITYGC